MSQPPTDLRFATGRPDRGPILLDQSEVSYDLEAGSRRDEEWLHEGLIDLRQCPRCRCIIRESSGKYCSRCGFGLGLRKKRQAGLLARPKVWIIGALVLMLGLLAFYLLRPQPPPTVTLTAVPSTVEKVQSVTLSWTSQNATELDLEPAVGKVPAKGSWSAIPQGSGTFTLRATGPGGTQIATARVTVTIPPPPIPPSIPRVDPEATIRKLMSAWVEAFQTRNAYALAECYAPSVETYFKWHNSSNAQVRGTLERVFSTTAEIHQYEISDINILPSANGRYIATFGKEWDTTKTNGRPFSGAEIERLTFATFGSDWKIVREEEIRILHVMGHGG